MESEFENETRRSRLVRYVAIALSAAVLIWFYCFQNGFGMGSISAIRWLYSCWDDEYAWMVPLFSVAVLYRRRSEWLSLPLPKKTPWCAFLPIALGAMLYYIGYSTMQERVVVAGLPFLLLGCICFFKGWQVVRICAFPCFFLWLMIPLPGFQQATVGMQLIATQAAHWGAALFGVQTVVEGTNIASADGSWDAYSIAGGCSGMRSLMSLLMISVAWAYLAPLSWWKKLVLAGSAIPLAVVGNAFRVTSIFVFAEYVNPAFASKTWHDWSGLLFFFPASLFGLTLLYSLLTGEIPFLRKRRTVIIRHCGQKGDSEQE